MPRPATIKPLPDDPNLPAAIRWLAEFFIYQAPSPDYLFLLATALEEAVERAAAATPEEGLGLLNLATDLRQRAPEYA